MPDISFDHVSVRFGDTEVLTDITTTLTERRIGVIGSNGGGKSTLVRLINGLGSPTSGTVTVDGADVRKNARAVRRRVGFVFSDADNQIVMPTVVEDVEFSLRKSGLSRTQRREHALALLERYGLADHADHSPHVLSGGQKQLLALASVMATNPETIIADEPTTLLDLRNRAMLKRIFSDLEQQLIAVTHDLDFIADFDRVLLIDDHQIKADGPPHDVIQHYVETMGFSA